MVHVARWCTWHEWYNGAWWHEWYTVVYDGVRWHDEMGYMYIYTVGSSSEVSEKNVQWYIQCCVLPRRQERADASNVWLLQRRGIFSELQVHSGSIYTGSWLATLHGCRPTSDSSGQQRRFLAGRCRWPLVEAAGGDDHARDGGSEKSGGGSGRTSQDL